ncbi:retinol dehydrogenase 12 isoform X2 [Entelurus aequoreus]|uniref:retinol dehydrogenase 12 isoform X2 n=1 Tax=Entelurus aequoreus TaxID=161455 RepID=UPI002B1D6032|nr:retinol dehydrogenase 12 isoform X2 [Entelurus aequoreus]
MMMMLDHLGRKTSPQCRHIASAVKSFPHDVDESPPQIKPAAPGIIRPRPHCTMDWWDVVYSPLWMVSTVLLALVVRLQRRGCWDPRSCPTQLRGKTAMVTGANSGIGKSIAMDFARRGARVLLACRSVSRGAAAAEEIKAKTGNSDVHVRQVDLSSLDSVGDLAEKILKEEKALHILVNNAAVSGLPQQITHDGFDVSFATNHLGPFLLTNLLTDLMKTSTPARIVTLSSVNHKKGEVDFSHFHGENLTHRLDRVYNHTKLHNIICTNELARRLQGTGVTANSVHPGVVMTGMMRHYPFRIRCIFNLIGQLFFKSAEEGAVSAIYCAVSEEAEGVTGKYFDSDCSLVLPAPLARDPALAAKDFDICQRLTSSFWMFLLGIPT